MSAARNGPPSSPPDFDWQHPARIAFTSLIGRGPVLIAVSSAFSGVAPDAVRAVAPHVCLRLGLGLSPSIPDLEWNDSGVIGTLTFSGAPYPCRIPWAAVVAMRLEDGDAPQTTAPRRRLRSVPLGDVS